MGSVTEPVTRTAIDLDEIRDNKMTNNILISHYSLSEYNRMRPNIKFGLICCRIFNNRSEYQVKLEEHDVIAFHRTSKF